MGPTIDTTIHDMTIVDERWSQALAVGPKKGVSNTRKAEAWVTGSGLRPIAGGVQEGLQILTHHFPPILILCDNWQVAPITAYLIVKNW
jgi:hypothetical protein